MKNQFIELTKHNKGVHVFYNISELDSYVENCVSYILSSIEQDRHTLLIENDRIYGLVLEKLAPLLNEEQLKTIHFINNYDYYFSTGSFHPPAIFAYLTKIVTPFFEKKIPFQTWAHVEWGEQKDIFNILEQFEQDADKLVIEQGLCLVCAYDQDRVPPSLHTSLMRSHGYTLYEENNIPSTLYEGS
ncbi:MEDS domain-containing protein [Cytobacillus purgationiresistens]|uniref:MEDS domain-containing protein n=1 Tax=Cytobacillus purgationiresistens TaxID=863449 RepID=A0ABU0AJG4_9BACI|nr:MEDS domain-containing protein [Cytobacillus purgationiresistens]MDQ0271407.1 hypothetical protein [Cytobacillus purgationiresistens]